MAFVRSSYTKEARKKGKAGEERMKEGREKIP